jgi:hypothetical protein
MFSNNHSMLVCYNKNGALSSCENQTADRLILSGELAKQVVPERSTPVTKYTTSSNFISIL